MSPRVLLLLVPFVLFAGPWGTAAADHVGLGELVQIAPRTLSRRKEEGRLQPDESDRLLRVSRLVGRALELFEGDLETARKWLSTPLRSLRGKAPLELVKTEVGAQEVEALIGRLEHGIIS